MHCMDIVCFWGTLAQLLERHPASWALTTKGNDPNTRMRNGELTASKGQAPQLCIGVL